MSSLLRTVPPDRRARGDPHRPRNTKRKALAMLAAAGVLGAGLLAVDQNTPRAHAATGERTVAQWNMNGAADGSDGSVPESRWQTQIRQMLRDGVEVAALQEAGNQPPESAVWTHRPFAHVGISEHAYNLGSHSRPDRVHIYWADPGQRRNGLAVVTRGRAEDARQLPVGGSFNSRPMMGVQVGGTWYFNAHALSNGPTRANDAADIIETARQFMESNHPGQDWMVLADFNRSPGQMPVNLQRHIVAANQPTHQGGAELDFAYMNQQNNTSVDAERGGANSDHHAYVRYHLNSDCAAGNVPRGDDGAGTGTGDDGDGDAGTGTGDDGGGGAGVGGDGGAGADVGTAAHARQEPREPRSAAAALTAQRRDVAAEAAARLSDLARNLDRRDPGHAEGCNDPVPGETYRVEPRHLYDAVLTDDDPDGDAPPPTLRRPSGDEREEVQVRFGNEPGQYLLSFSDGWCLTRYTGPSDAVTEIPCDDPETPAPTTAHWRFLRGQIVTPDLNGTLRPSPNERGAALKTGTDFYQWRFVPLR